MSRWLELEIKESAEKLKALLLKYKTVHQMVRYRLKAKLKVARPSHLTMGLQLLKTV
ncbi:hypothetical protein [Nitrosococcus wardiae]|uniref:hypothetical protein n=1 Tax=Nitrosococcus wardiae TaxID=1814290 RepID=UPI00141B3C8C|nr:hypothetical protein [Nitrosococcus wardiae]